MQGAAEVVVEEEEGSEEEASSWCRRYRKSINFGSALLLQREASGAMIDLTESDGEEEGEIRERDR